MATISPPPLPAAFPESIRAINRLSDEEKRLIYGSLIPAFFFQRFGIDQTTWLHNGHPLVQLRAPSHTRAVELSVFRRPWDIDPTLYLHLVDTLNGQLLVLLIVVNDVDAPRFAVDRLATGESTHMGTAGRNLAAEKLAMQAGLAPGQVRAGLRIFRQLTPIFESFVRRMGLSLYFIEPFAYHNAIVFERYGFQYVRGRLDMERIHAGFQPGGALYDALDGSSPFRRPEMAHTVRGRSWAVHDGVLGKPFSGFQMVKRLDHPGDLNTFPGAVW